MTTNRNINDLIVEKIHSSFVELLPEDELRNIVESELDRFKTPRQTGDRWNPKTAPSPLEAIVYAAIEKLVKVEVEKHVDAMTQTRFDAAGQQVASDMIKALVAQSAELALASFVQRSGEIAAMNSVLMLKNELRTVAFRSSGGRR